MTGTNFAPTLVADQNKIRKLVEVVRQAKTPLMVREIADRLGVSTNTAGKYVDVCKALGLVDVHKYATAKQVTITKKGQETGTQ